MSKIQIDQPAKTEQFIGTKFGLLTVTNFAGYRGVTKRGVRSPYWTCTCDCGKVIEVHGSTLNNGKKPNQSCGCTRLIHLKQVHEDRKQKVSATDSTSFNLVWHSYRNAAKQRGYDWDLTKEQFRSLTSGDCEYCNEHPTKIKADYKIEKREKALIPYIYNGIDRIDNNVGYSIANCVSCCTNCNLMKGQMKRADFLQHIRKIFNHSVGT